MARPRETGLLRNGLWVLVGALLAVWVVDVLLNLGLLRQVLVGSLVIARPQDFLGLLIAETPLSLAAAAGAWLGGAAVAARSGRGSRLESAALLAAAVSALVLVCRVSWPFDPAAIRVGLIVGPPIGLSILLLLRWMIGHVATSEAPWLSRLVGFVVLPPLASGYAAASILGGLRGQSHDAAVSGAAAVTVLALLGVVWRGRKPLVVSLAGWALPVTALALAGLSSFATLRYGAFTDRLELSDSGRPNVVLIVLDTVRADRLAACVSPRQFL